MDKKRNARRFWWYCKRLLLELLFLAVFAISVKVEGNTAYTDKAEIKRWCFKDHLL